MSNSIYATIARQDGLLKELQVVANNIANTNTSGFKTDRAVFAEYVMATGPETPSLSIGGLAGHSFDLTQGTVKFTGGQFDLAIQGEGAKVMLTWSDALGNASFCGFDLETQTGDCEKGKVQVYKD